jgi:hypothetical protein
VTTYRLFPSTNGPASPVSFGGSFISGVVFGVAGGGNWLDGYWWWCAASGQSTSAVKCALWSPTSSGSGVVVAGSTVTSGTLTAGAWNYIPLASPVQLAPSLDPSTATFGSAYIAAVGFTGDFPDTNSFWGSKISNGPLTAYASGAVPYGLPQGVFSTAGSDPGVTMPQSSSGTDNFWVDVQVSDTAPAGYGGSFRLWPNKADANNTITGDSALNYTIGTEIDLSGECTLNYVWYYSQSGAASLATRCDVWNISTGLSVASIASPSWLTASGGAASAGGGWIKAAFAGGTTLAAGSYRVTVFNSGGTSGSWAAKDASSNYFGQGGTGGAGAAGITWGPLTAPAQPSAGSGFVYAAGSPGATPPYSSGTAINAQPPFGQTPGGTVVFPQLYAPVGAGVNQSQNYWVDLEATPPPVIQGAAALAGSGTLTAGASVSIPAAASLSGSGTLAAPGQKRAPGAAALSGTGTLTAGGRKAVPGAVALSGTGALGAAASLRVAAAAALSGSGTLTATGSGGPVVAPQQGTVSIANALSATVSVSNVLQGTVTIVNTA